MFSFQNDFSQKGKVGCFRIYPCRGKRQTDLYKKIRRKFYFFVKIRHIKYIKQKNIISERKPVLYGKKHNPVIRRDETNCN